ncbi:hypothetical protein F0562_007743 [Nyssa sinensis]|uniref:Uncharacterized protein n=1 Tax=Nyssa sinensis TaxID=561372 RepID=A0A5J5A9T7_9ASTE|nr:hypothetical protein F0562_007743 [Nyssa sinensis]
MNIITELTDQHSKASELQLEAETRISEAETQLKEAIQKLTLRDSEARELNEKLTALEGQIRMYEEQANEASAVAESRKVELDQTLLKLKDLESTIEEMQTKSGLFEKECVGLAEANLKLTQELATYEVKLNDLQTKLFASSTEKDETIEQLQSSKKAIEDLTQQLTSEGQRLHTQISSVMEENNLLNETYQNAKKELEDVSIQFEEKTKEHKLNEDALKAEMENLKAEIGEKTVLQNLLKELEEKSTITEARLKEEVESAQVAAANREAELTSKLEDHVQKVHDRDILNDQLVQLQKELHIAQSTIAEQKEADSQKELEHEATLKRSSEELEAKSNTVLLLEKQVKELEQKLQLADAKLKEKADEGSPAVEVKSRDIGSTISTPSKRRSKKKLEATPAQTSSSSDTHTQTTEVSPAMNYKFILGIALVSVIIGVILGKRY